jgi:hypothetical protein
MQRLSAKYVESSWNVMAHGDAREGKWRGNWRMEWVASTLTLPRNMVYPALLTLMRTPRLPAVDWTDAPADLHGLVRFAERRSPVSARVPSHFKPSLPSKGVLILAVQQTTVCILYFHTPTCIGWFWYRIWLLSARLWVFKNKFFTSGNTGGKDTSTVLVSDGCARS